MTTLIGLVPSSENCDGGVNDRPTFVDASEGPDRTVGILLVVPSGDATENQAAALAEVERLVAALAVLTSSTDDVSAWELDGEVVGWVEAGTRDELLERGLLAPWRERLNS